MTPPPPPLSRTEFAARRERLIRDGVPVTLWNIDPAFAAWHHRAMRRRHVRLVVLAIGTAALMAVVWRLNP